MNSYSEEEKNKIFDEIIEDIEIGAEALVLSLKGRLSSSTFYKWLDDDSDKAKRYARACEIRQELMFEHIWEIANTPEEGIETISRASGVEIKTGDMLGHRRLKIDALKWQLSKLNPKKYGDKIDHTTDGEKINNPTIIKWGDDEIEV